MELVRSLAGEVPLFGVCLGLQAMGVAFGGTVDRAPELLHGKTSLVEHDGSGVFAGLPSPITATLPWDCVGRGVIPGSIARAK